MSTLELQLIRYDCNDKRTIGKLSINGSFQMYTCEDPIRPVKIPGETAIPNGRYEVVLTGSERFGCMMPLLLDVPNFTGVRIHKGNKPSDTDGCVLVGHHRGQDEIYQSATAYNALYSIIEAALKAGRQVFITIERQDLQADPPPTTTGTEVTA